MLVVFSRCRYCNIKCLATTGAGAVESEKIIDRQLANVKASVKAFFIAKVKQFPTFVVVVMCILLFQANGFCNLELWVGINRGTGLATE